MDLSSDGTSLLFVEYSAGANYSVCMRKTDGSPTVVLGEGEPTSLSGDDQWALTLLHTNPSRLLLVPTGAGEVVRLPQIGLSYQPGAQWFPDSKRILFAASEAGKGTRLWTQRVFPQESPQPFTGEGMSISGHSISPDSKMVVAKAGDGKLVLVPIGGGQPQPIRGVEPGDQLVRWSIDGRSLFFNSGARCPSQVYKLNLQTGAKERWRDLDPVDASGVFMVGPVLLTPDGSSTVYGLLRYLYNLQLLDGVH